MDIGYIKLNLKENIGNLVIYTPKKISYEIIKYNNKNYYNICILDKYIFDFGKFYIYQNKKVKGYFYCDFKKYRFEGKKTEEKDESIFLLNIIK